MIVVYIFVGILLGAGGSYFILNNKMNENKLANANLQTQLEAEKQQHQKDIEHLKEQYERETVLRDEQNSREQKLRQEQFAQQLETVQEQFQNLATKILEQTSLKLKTDNVESIAHITQPLKQNIEQLQLAIDKTNNETAKNTASLSEQLRSMAEQTAKIDASATRLTNVMQGANKVQGNWGELTLMNLLDSRSKEETDTVTLSTLHASKGLEYPHVILAGCEEGLFPHADSVEEGNLDEERRLMYVGITRAKHSLTLTHCVKRRRQGGWQFPEPSRFIDEMPQADLKILGRKGGEPIVSHEEGKANLRSMLDMLNAKMGQNK